MTIRKVAPEDAETITKVRLDSWELAYSDILGKELIENRRKKMFDGIEGVREYLREAKYCYLAEENGEIAGVMEFGKARNLKFENTGEIYSIYISPEYVRHGIGSALFDFAAAELKKIGFSKMLVNVMKDNKIGKAFYDKKGGKPKEEFKSPLGDKIVVEERYFFDL